MNSLWPPFLDTSVLHAHDIASPTYLHRDSHQQLWVPCGRYFHEGFTFTFFASQEPFAKKLKRRILFVVCVQQSVLLGTIYRPASRGVSGSMPLTAIAEAIQEIKVLWKYRCTNTTVAQVWEQKQLLLQTSWLWGYFPHHTGTKSWDCNLSL